MAMDGLALSAVTHELQKLTGGKIDKVQQPEKDMLLFTVRAGGENMRLLFCSHAENGRVHLTQKAYENPENAPAFCMLLRRRLVGGRIAGVRQEQALERVFYLDISARDELQDNVTLTFVMELMGKHANMLLLDGDNTIIDCLRRVSASDTGARILLPGFPYEPVPAQEKRSLLDASQSELSSILNENDPARTLCSVYGGLSRQTANALLIRFPSAAILYDAIAGFRACRFFPALGETGVFPFRPDGAFSDCPGMSEAYDSFYAARDRQAHMQRHSSALRRVCEQALKRARNRQSAYFDALHNDSASERSRQCGEWILANLHSIRPGDKQAAVENYFTDPPTRELVELDPRLSAKDNAQKYFKQYKKAKAARSYAAEQMSVVNAEIDYLEGQLQNIANADMLAELEEIRDELIRERYIRPDKKPARRLPRAVSEPMRFISSDGIRIRVGKNNRQNDVLTLKDAKPDNLFLHAKNIPGSHVIIDYPGEPPQQTLQEAAMLAAFFSGARGSSSVPVDYTERRFVKKPSGARPGLVVYSTNRSLYVTPDPALVDRIKD